MSDRGSSSPRVEALGNSRFAVTAASGKCVGYAVVKGRETWVWLNGRTCVLSSDATNESVARVRTDDMAMAAPMPATVRAIAVSEGQMVSAGDVLVVLEAMKMELAIKAPRDGSISAVHCALGEIVQPGIPLVELE